MGKKVDQEKVIADIIRSEFKRAHVAFNEADPDAVAVASAKRIATYIRKQINKQCREIAMQSKGPVVAGVRLGGYSRR